MCSKFQILIAYSLDVLPADKIAGWVHQNPIYLHAEGDVKAAQQSQKTLPRMQYLSLNCFIFKFLQLSTVVIVFR